MSGEDIIKRINEVKEMIIREEYDRALLFSDYIIDDIFMYRKNCL